MNYMSKDLAAQMESCIKQTHIEVTKGYEEGQILEINGGAACFSGFDSYLSQVIGWGFLTRPEQFESEIDKIEHFYATLNHSRIDIELCPFTGNDLAVFLSQRGYGISELNNVSALDLKAYQPVDSFIDIFEIRQINPSEINEWAKKVALGFGCPEAEKQFIHYVRAKGTVAFAAYDNVEMIAGGTVAIHGEFCDLGVTSTLPAYRGQGIQKKLIQARLNFAKQQGLSWALVTTEPGTISDLNIQKVGFRCAYTRIKMTME